MKAFPVDILDERTGKVCAQECGMSLRDYFAAKAMQGILSNPSIEDAGIIGDPADTKLLVDNSYKIADAMIEQRNQGAK